MPAPSSFSLEQQLADLREEVRSLSSGNPANRTSVTNAEGRFVELPALAFGQAAAADNGLVELWGVANAGPGSAGWAVGLPAVWVRVTGGRLRVDVAGALSASGNKCSAFLSYRVSGPAETQGGATPVVAVPPAYDRSVEVQHSHSGQDQRAAASTFGLHEGLAEGWYRVETMYALSYSGSSLTPYGSFQNRRLAATPY
jgi:hypothetical protein